MFNGDAPLVCFVTFCLISSTSAVGPLVVHSLISHSVCVITDATPAPPPAWTPGHYLAAARGLSALYWGLLLIVLVMVGTLVIHLPIAARLPGHTAGLLLLLVGCWHLRPVWTGPGAGHAWLRVLAGMVVLQFYLVPFLGWWRAGTAAWYAALNILLLIVGGIVLLAAIPHLVRRLAHQIGNTELEKEARISGWLVPVMGGVSLFLYALPAGRLAWETDPAFALRHLLTATGPLMLFPAVLPFIPAMAVAWSGKESALLALLPGPDRTLE